MGKIYKNGIEYGGGGGGDSAGHIILDNDGTAMAEEPNLQFKGLNVTDNSTDEITEVESVGLNQDSMDDVLNASISGNQVASNGLVYSTEEQVVGKWIDGKPLYQRTFQFTCSSGTNSVMLDSTMTAPTYRLVSGDFIKWVGTSGDSWYQTISSEETSSKYCYVGTTPTGLQAAYGGRSAGNLIYVTVKYIKTTD